MPKTVNSPLVTILGPTASGKTRLGVELASAFNGEIISADSRQVYRGMDIGTGKDLDEYQHIPYHLIDVIEPDEEYNLFRFADDFAEAFTKITTKNKLPLLVGGTGMYLDAALRRYTLTIANIDEKARESLEKKSQRELIALLESFDNNLHNTTDLTSKDRLIRAVEIAIAEQENAEQFVWPEFNNLVIGIKVDRDEIKKRITCRLKERLNEGMIDEVEQLKKQGVSWEKLHFFGLEYRYIASYLQGTLNYNDMFQKLNSAIHYFAKQQEKWFRNIQKKGVEIHWIEKDELLPIKAHKLVEAHLASNTLNW